MGTIWKKRRNNEEARKTQRIRLTLTGLLMEGVIWVAEGE
jgi:hypothetical protein